jgi:L-aspartate semialdehyde sulfurtransferase ferredoxin
VIIMKHKVGLLFPKDMMNKPVVCDMSRRFDLSYNILRAKIDGGMVGKMIMEIDGGTDVIEAAVSFLRDEGIHVIPMPESAAVNREKCMDCGACTGVCPTGALALSPAGELVLDNALCVLCDACRPACPMRAITTQHDLNFD